MRHSPGGWQHSLAEPFDRRRSLGFRIERPKDHPAGQVTAAELCGAHRNLHRIPIAVVRRGQRIEMNPGPSLSIDLDALDAAYVVANSRTLAVAFAEGEGIEEAR